MSYQKITVHCGIGGNPRGIGDYFRRLDAAGRPAAVCSYDNYGIVKELIDLRIRSGVPHIGVFRPNIYRPHLPDQNPDYNKQPEAAGRDYWEQFKRQIPPEVRDPGHHDYKPQYKELTWMIWGNEGRKEVIWEDGRNGGNWWGEVAHTIATLAMADGYRTLAFGFSAGTPEEAIWKTPGMRKYLRLCHRHPNQCGIALHEGADPKHPQPPPFGPLINSEPNITGRYQHMFAACDEMNIRRPRIFISECAWYYRDAPDVGRAMHDVREAAIYYDKHPEVLGVSLWTVGSSGGSGEYGDIANKVQQLIQPLTDYALESRWDGKPTWPDGAPHYQGELQPSTLDSAEAAGFDTSISLDLVEPGTQFEALWSFKNTGNSTWNKNYQLVFSDKPHAETGNFPRSSFGSKTVYTLNELGAPNQVKPGQTVQLKVPLTAPVAAGTQATNWQLQNKIGKRFGPIRWLRAVIPTSSLSYAVDNFVNTVGDYNNVQPGQQFTATWTLRNTSATAWSGDFVFANIETHVEATTDAALADLAMKQQFTLRELSGKDEIRPNETVDLSLKMTAPQEPNVYASHWELRSADGVAFGGTRWLYVRIVGTTRPPQKPKTKRTFQPGMNINVPEAHGIDGDRLAGLEWVRYVFRAAARHRTVPEAFTLYDTLVQAYAEKGIRSLIILNQETVWGNGPWDNGDWPSYGRQLADAARIIAKHYAVYGDQVAYQIWNEGDSVGNPSAVHAPADQFAGVLRDTAAAIRAAAPEAKIVFGGLNTGPDSAVAYAKRVRDLLGGKLPVDALAYHPYGRHAKTNFFGWPMGKLRDAIRPFEQTFPDTPLWITEVGVESEHAIGPEHYGRIANYMGEMVEEIAVEHADYVPVLIWFAWNDVMRNAGMLTADGKEKPHVYDAYRTMRDWGIPQFESADALASLPLPSAFIGFDSTLTDYNAVPAGSSFTYRWRFRNTSQRTWDDSYRLVYAPKNAPHNDPMIAKTEYKLSEVAAPMPAKTGDEIVIELNLTAPKEFGRTYQSRWEFRDAADTPIGHFYAEITVTAPLVSDGHVRVPDMRWIADLTTPDGTRLREGTTFVKQWRVENSGERHWGDGFRLVHVAGNPAMAKGIAAHIVPATKNGEQVVLSVPMAAPTAASGRATTFESHWRLQDDRGNFFGDTIWAKIVSLPTVAQPTTQANLNDPSGWYAQRDARWNGNQLGHGQQTIGSWGCLLTCFAMMLTAYGRRVTPAQLNEQFQREPNSQGFNGSAVQFAAPIFALKGLRQDRNVRSWEHEEPGLQDTLWTGEHPLQRIDDAIAAGHVVIAQVDSDRGTDFDQHWVIIKARTSDGSDYLMIDPLTPPESVHNQPSSLMAKYGNRVASESNDTNLRNAIKSALIYRYEAGPIGG